MTNVLDCGPHECLALLPPDKRDGERLKRLDKICRCPGCGNKVSGAALVLNTGALFKTGESSAAVNDDLCGFFSFSWHDHDRSERPHVDIEESPTPGQIELYFHGTACLRAWFERVVRRLER